MLDDARRKHWFAVDGACSDAAREDAASWRERSKHAVVIHREASDSAEGIIPAGDVDKTVLALSFEATHHPGDPVIRATLPLYWWSHATAFAQTLIISLTVA